MALRDKKVKPRVVFVLGGPGSGKGTQCEYIVRDFGYGHLSAGELLRIEMKDVKSSVRPLIQQHMKDGTIVPVEITAGLLSKTCVNRCMARGETSGRVDDNPDTLKLRVDTFNEKTMPIIEHFQKKNRAHRIDANRTKEEIYADVKLIFEKLMNDIENENS